MTDERGTVDDPFKRRHPVDDNRSFLTRYEIEDLLDRIKKDVKEMISATIAASRLLSEGEIKDEIDRRVAQFFRNVHLGVGDDPYRESDGFKQSAQLIDHMRNIKKDADDGKSPFSTFLKLAGALTSFVVALFGAIWWVIAHVSLH